MRQHPSPNMFYICYAIVKNSLITKLLFFMHAIVGIYNNYKADTLLIIIIINVLLYFIYSFHRVCNISHCCRQLVTQVQLNVSEHFQHSHVLILVDI